MRRKLTWLSSLSQFLLDPISPSLRPCSCSVVACSSYSAHNGDSVLLLTVDAELQLAALKVLSSYLLCFQVPDSSAVICSFTHEPHLRGNSGSSGNLYCELQLAVLKGPHQLTFAECFECLIWWCFVICYLYHLSTYRLSIYHPLDIYTGVVIWLIGSCNSCISSFFEELPHWFP